MPTRKVTERERLTIFARTASDDELEQALEILRVEAQVRRATKQPAKKAAAAKKSTPPPAKVESNDADQS